MFITVSSQSKPHPFRLERWYQVYQVILAGIWASVPASSGVIRGTLLFICLFRILCSLCPVPPPLCSIPSHGFEPIQLFIEVAVEA